MRVALAGRDTTKGTVSRWTLFLTLTISCLLFTFSAFAQSDRGTITGTVSDPSAAAVAGAKVEVRNLDNGSVYNPRASAPLIMRACACGKSKWNWALGITQE